MLKKKPFLTAKPFSLSIEPTNHCNLHCPECLTGSGQLSRAKGNISVENFRLIIDEVHKELSYLLLYFQGEPFLHPQYTDLIRYAKSKRIFVASSTNGHFLTPSNATAIIQSGLDYLIISLDGVTQASYQTYRRGGDFNQVIEGIKTLVQLKKASKATYPLIELQFIAFRHNEQEIDAFKKLAAELGVDRATIKSAQLYHPNQSKEILPPSNPNYSRYRRNESGEYRLIARKQKYCRRQWNSAVITWDGNVVPCCFDKQARYSYGNVKENSVYTLWKSQQADQLRKNILQRKNLPDICLNCPSKV